MVSPDSHATITTPHPLTAKRKNPLVNFPLRIGGAAAVGAAALFLTGCASYHALFLDSAAVEKALRPADKEALSIAVHDLKHPLLRPVRLDASDGLSPDEAAVLAVVLNPALRATRDQCAEAEAQLLKAGILPNPQLSGNLDFVTGGATAGTQTGTGYGLSWDLRSLITHGQEVASARTDLKAVRLDVAWEEWQTALEARSAVYDLIALNAQVTQAEEISDRLASNAALVKKAEDAREMSLMDSSTVTVSANDARSTLLALQQEREQRRIALNRAIGYPASTQLRLQGDASLPSRVDPPSEATLLHGLEERRLDMLALKRGYESEDAKLRAAILGQFPNINIGFSRASDTGNVHSIGPAITIDRPLFDRNQGAIALENATRKRLFDEYTNRVFEARSDIAAALADIHSLNAQISQAESALPAFRQVVETSGKAVDEGNAEILGHYTLQNDLTQKSLDILKLKQQLAQARIALETAAAWHL
jgi:outer membrane protein TolC